MVRMLRHVLLPLAIVTALFAVPAASAFPAFDEEVFTWRVDDEAGDAHPMCFLFSSSTPPDPNDSPCDLISFEMGNTETHMLFRWHVATLEFGPLTPPDAYVEFDTRFHGTAIPPDFRIKPRLAAEGEPETVWAGPDGDPQWEAWRSAMEWDVDRGAGVLLGALPIELLAPMLERGVAAGEYFNVTNDVSGLDYPRVVFHYEGVGCQPTLSPLNCVGDVFEVDDEDRTYELRAEGRFQPIIEGPEVFHRERSGLPASVSLVLTEPTDEIWRYNWTGVDADFRLNHTIERQQGFANVTLTDPAGRATVLRAQGGVANGTLEFVNATAGTWRIEVALADFVGSVRLDFGALPATTGDTDVGDDKKGLPAPGAVLLLMALAAFLGLRRRLAHKHEPGAASPWHDTCTK